ncbi:MAG: ABC transporter ATP-binding protein [Provencibacterium sp.]|jgi:ABC-2 type transport system ATP-binding protein|nr:ABC transporter ATP-binding protein [Provencibacterium sp.]
MEPILECRVLGKRYGSKQALASVDLKVERGRIVGLLGPNGSGKTTLIKLATGLLSPSAGQILIDGKAPGVETKELVSYLPDRPYLGDWMKVNDIIDLFADFYRNFDRVKALEMLARLSINPADRLKTMSKGTKEKVQLILVMSRSASLYLLDEPIGGVDPATRDYILSTIIGNYSEEAAVVISTHLIADVERVLDDVVFIENGRIALSSSVDAIREERGMSVDALFREVFKC